MTLDALIMLAGFLVALLPFLGFPIRWDNVLLVGLGVIIIMLGIIVRRRGFGERPRSTSTYVESAPQSEVQSTVHESL